MTDADAISRAGYIIAEFLVSMAGNKFREGDVVKALHGDTSGLYIWEQEAVEWLLQYREQIPAMNLWTAGLLKSVHERRAPKPY